MPEHHDGLAAAKRLGIPGCCIFCETLLVRKPRGRIPFLCRERGCRRAYWRAYHRDHPEHRGGPRPSRGETFWHCGCGMVTRRSGWGSHRPSCIFAANAYPVVIIVPRGKAAA